MRSGRFCDAANVQMDVSIEHVTAASCRPAARFHVSLQNRTRRTVVVQDAIIKPFCAGVNNVMVVVYSDEVCSV